MSSRTESTQNQPTGASPAKILILMGLLATTTFTAFLVRDSTHVTRQPFFQFVYTIFFVSGLLGLPIFFVVKFVVKVEHPDYSDFDTIVAAVAETVQPNESSIKGSLKTPLLQSTPPPSVAYHFHNKQHTIVTKKTGHPFQEGLTSNSIVRLNFTETTYGFSIQGTNSLQSREASCTSFDIQEGLYSNLTEKVYWVEASSNGLRRVVTGKFEDNFTNFTGEWCSSDGTRGVLGNTAKSESAGMASDLCVSSPENCCVAVPATTEISGRAPQRRKIQATDDQADGIAALPV